VFEHGVHKAEGGKKLAPHRSVYAKKKTLKNTQTLLYVSLGT
jgi:hypothetical protein